MGMSRCTPWASVSKTATARGVACSPCGNGNCDHAEKDVPAASTSSVTAHPALRYRYLVMDTNEKALDFTLPDENGDEITLSALKGKPIVLFFYPRANTPGCTVEACGFRDSYAKLTRAGLTVLGISPDTSKAQKKFQEKFELPYPLLADADKTVAKLYDVLKEKNMYGKKVMGIERTTFFIGPDGKIKNVWRKVKPEGHADEVLAWFKAQK